MADFTVGALISGFANSFGMLLFGRMIQGIGTGLILPLMFTVAMLIFPPKKLGLAMGQAASASSSEALRFEHGVHYGFCFTLALALIGFIVSLRLKDRKQSEDVDFD